MSDQYGLPDFRQFMAGRTQYFPAITQPTEPPFFLHKNVAPPLHCEPTTTIVAEVLPRGQLVGFAHHDSTDAALTAAATTTLCSSQMESGWMGYEGGSTRWPRQETLTLLEIRSRLDSKFKETNQKGPLWDEVSRIMAEEHAYQRSGKKCKEKFENLYKYYKKTKEGKAGRQGGKHYRFFRQLEAIYGEASNHHASASELHLERNSLPYHQIPNNIISQENQEVVSFTNSSEFETSSSENNIDDHDLNSAIAIMMNQGKQKETKRSWKGKIEEFVDSQMRKIIDTQEAWMERMLGTIEDREQERVCKEEEWRKQEAARFDQEVHELWAKERAWVEARDAALMGALKKFVGKGLENENDKEFLYGTIDNNRWTESEISGLIHVRNSLELRFQEGGYLEEGLWEEIAAKMGSLGYDRRAIDYKEKWENISIYYNKKEKEDLDLRSSGFCQQLNSYLSQGISKQRLTVDGLPPSSSFNYTRNEGENVWEKYGVKLNKGKNQQV